MLALNRAQIAARNLPLSSILFFSCESGADRLRCGMSWEAHSYSVALRETSVCPCVSLSGIEYRQASTILVSATPPVEAEPRPGRTRMSF